MTLQHSEMRLWQLMQNTAEILLSLSQTARTSNMAEVLDNASYHNYRVVIG